ncbi:2-hydroxy-acid oxidase [Aureimonas endophytica]|uniref:D-lactate dehydrogenase (cytochrome) n=1 Tax=Aureimonas endophytica TaxID=2027858 RepID=A0A916ZN02_9HYPH|nr:FAD-linked oxidase C-terminal domain-containing protein [Aureimonas endophytica]GGE05684.1 2-hydroxy-acid oxidase [Aureimonas endophytica]
MGDTAPSHDSPAWAELDALFPGRIERGHALREQHAVGDSWHPAMPPDAVLMVETTEEVAAAVAACHRHGLPVVPFGAGSSIEGQVQAARAGLSLDLSRMTRILRISPGDMDCTVEAGVTRQALNEDLRATGLFFPIDVGAHATLGGLASTNASGTITVRYGTMRSLVLGLTVVLPDGRVVRTGGRARKSSSGYDLTRLFVGAEGTLGIITELTLRLHGVPEKNTAALASFDTIDDATETVVEAMQCGLALNRIELLDASQVRAINLYNRTDLPEKPSLMIDMAGAAAQVAADMDVFGELAAARGAVVRPADTPEDYSALWKLRHSALYAARALRPGCKSLSTDVCVPVTELPGVIHAIRAELDAANVLAPLHGHVGDGNFHLVMLFDPDSPKEMDDIRRLHARLIEMALRVGGTITGEHGVGLGKKSYMEAEHGEALDVMRQIKRALDPANILNPGKIFDL